MLNFEITTWARPEAYEDSNLIFRTYHAVYVTFDDAEAFLGRPHNGSENDDRLIVAELRRLGAPEWVDDKCERDIDEFGLYVLGPEVDTAVSG